MQHWPAGSIVNIRTNESCIPWELLHDGDNFLGAKFILCRLPLVSERSRMPQTEACIAYVEGETIEGSVSPSEIFGNYPFPVQQPVPMTIDSLRELARRAIILHFFCRAETEGSTNSFRLGMDSHQKLLPAELLTFTLQENALVLANLCQSAETNLCLQGFIDFASEFYKAGAQAYIGAIAEIPAQSASFFSNLFYRYLQNTPAYKAVYLAKKQCHRLYMRTVIDSDLLQESETQMYHQEFEMHGGITNPFWLFYSYYGNPARWKPIQGEQ
jgi:CHAT domain-containing protein